MPNSDASVISKLSAVTGCSAADLHARGDHVCPDCHARLLSFHRLEDQVARERTSLAALFRCSRPVPSAPPPPGSSLLLVDGLEVRLQNDDVTAVPVTSRRRRQLLRQAKSSDEKRFECKVCGKRFRAFSHRVEHMLIHIGDRPHACQLCPKTFRTRSSLTAHQRVHAPSGSGPSCPVCRRRLADAASLNNHLRTHTARKPFTCDTCGRQFSRAKDRAVHVRQHTGERPHQCPQCPQTFVARSRLNRHLLVHREKAFACGCGRAFRRRYDLQSHTRGCEQAAAGVQGCVTTPAAVAAAAAAPVAYLSAVVLPEPSPALYYQMVAPVQQSCGADGAVGGRTALGIGTVANSRTEVRETVLAGSGVNSGATAVSAAPDHGLSGACSPHAAGAS